MRVELHQEGDQRALGRMVTEYLEELSRPDTIAA
jgi:hypothetical protein